jgi:hypothetical protein
MLILGSSELDTSILSLKSQPKSSPLPPTPLPIKYCYCDQCCMKLEGTLINQAQCPTNQPTLAPASGMEGAKISCTCLT